MHLLLLQVTYVLHFAKSLRQNAADWNAMDKKEQYKENHTNQLCYVCRPPKIVIGCFIVIENVSWSLHEADFGQWLSDSYSACSFTRNFIPHDPSPLASLQVWLMGHTGIKKIQRKVEAKYSSSPLLLVASLCLFYGSRPCQKAPLFMAPLERPTVVLVIPRDHSS